MAFILKLSPVVQGQRSLPSLNASIAILLLLLLLVIVAAAAAVIGGIVRDEFLGTQQCGQCISGNFVGQLISWWVGCDDALAKVIGFLALVEHLDEGRIPSLLLLSPSA
eukprot:GEZU01027370.1.p2 GENE.GEZU01027370.1~~GEZU01027370.1.p2  ORF type:complete len:109 (+),score=17.47 GEZU01027370.1:12-338(+)